MELLCHIRDFHVLTFAQAVRVEFYSQKSRFLPVLKSVVYLFRGVAQCWGVNY